jgi:hypothetical protein
MLQSEKRMWKSALIALVAFCLAYWVPIGIIAALAFLVAFVAAVIGSYYATHWWISSIQKDLQLRDQQRSLKNKKQSSKQQSS